MTIIPNKQEFVCKALQDAFGSAAQAVLVWCAGTGQLVGIPLFVGTLKCKQPLLKLVWY